MRDDPVFPERGVAIVAEDQNGGEANGQGRERRDEQGVGTARREFIGMRSIRLKRLLTI